MHYYPFNIGDYIKSTQHLTNEEDICYRRLLDWYYDTEGPIPIDIPAVARRVRSTQEIAQSVLDEFFERADEGYRNHRADIEISAFRQYIETQRANGARGGRPKKTLGNPITNPSITDRKPTVKPTNNQEPTNNNQDKNVDAPAADDSENQSPKSPRQRKEKVTDGTPAPHADHPPQDIPKELWGDFLRLWSKSKKVFTNTALSELRREAEKAGWTLQQVLERCCKRGQVSFEAAWVGTDAGQAIETPKRWQDSVSGIRNKGIELKIPWRHGTTIGQYTKLLEEHLAGPRP